MDQPSPVADRKPANLNLAPDLLFLQAEAARRAIASPGAPLMTTVRDVFRRRLPFMRFVDRLGTRGLMLLARRQILQITGIEHILTPQPFILALNHSTRREALIVPAALVFHRGGRLIHFWSDWMFRLIPGLGFVMRRSGTIVVPTKRSRFRFLNVLRPMYEHREPALEQARAHLKARRAVGVFPEGTTNRDPRRLLPGRHGAARLSLETGVPIVPAGIRFPQVPASGSRVPEHAAMEICIGAPLMPPPCAGPRPTFAEVSAWHATLMSEIARLSGKTWQPRTLPAVTAEQPPTAHAA